MYGYANDHATDNNLVRNEISFTNLIAIANNKMLFDALDPETKQQLVKIIAIYTKGCIESINSNRLNTDAKYIQEHTK